MKQNENPKSKSWMKYLLIASLGLNLLIAGLFVGVFAGGKNQGSSRVSQNVSVGMMQFVKPLPEDERKALFAQFKKLKPHRRDASKALRSKNSEILELIRAETLNAEELNAAFESQHGLIAGVLSKGRAGLVDVISSMSLEERKAYATAVELELKKKPKRKKDRSKRQPD